MTSTPIIEKNLENFFFKNLYIHFFFGYLEPKNNEMAQERYLDLADDYNDDIVLFFRKYIEASGLASLIKFNVIGDEKQKKIIDIKINSPLHKFITKLDLIITVNHTVFEHLEDRDKLIIIDDHLSGLYFDHKTEKLKKNLGKQYGDLLTKKYGIDTLISVNEVISKIYEQQKDNK